MKNNKNTGSTFSIDKIKEFCKANVKYVSAGAMTAALVLVLFVSACNDKNNGNSSPGAQDTQQEETEQGNQGGTEHAEGDEGTKDSKENETNPEIQELVSTYYNSYAAGDLDKLSSLTKHLSDMEKDYIKMMNKHVESYDNVTCIVETGKAEDEYIVSAAYDMKFAGAEEALPGMNVFYVQTSEEGELFINNKYSSFNREINEQKTNKKVLKLIKEFEESENIEKLRTDIQERYDKILEGDKKLQKKVNKVAKAITKWKDTYTPGEEPEEPKQEEPEQKPEEPKQEEPEQKPEEPKQEEPEQKPEEPEESAEDESSDEGESSGVNYVPEGKVLTATDGYNVRVSMNESAELVGTTAVGDSIKVILSYAEGWTKVEWNGTTGYIRTDLLLAN